MWDKIIMTAKTLSSMLKNGEVPPNTPQEYTEDLSKINFLASKKFYVVFCSVIILALFYGISIFVLFLTAPLPTITPAFVTIFVETIKILAIIIGSYLGVQTIIDYKSNSNSSTNYTGENKYLKEELENKDITVIKTNIKEDDYELK